MSAYDKEQVHLVSEAWSNVYVLPWTSQIANLSQLASQNANLRQLPNTVLLIKHRVESRESNQPQCYSGLPGY